MTTLKRITAGAAALCLCFAMAGCGDNDNSEKEGEKATTTTTASSVEESKADVSSEADVDSKPAENTAFDVSKIPDIGDKFKTLGYVFADEAIGTVNSDLLHMADELYVENFGDKDKRKLELLDTEEGFVFKGITLSEFNSVKIPLENDEGRFEWGKEFNENGGCIFAELGESFEDTSYYAHPQNYKITAVAFDVECMTEKQIKDIWFAADERNSWKNRDDYYFRMSDPKSKIDHILGKGYEVMASYDGDTFVYYKGKSSEMDVIGYRDIYFIVDYYPDDTVHRIFIVDRPLNVLNEKSE